NTMLSNLDAIHISAVLEDCGDQLAILGHIMPSSLEGRSDASQIVDEELGEILQGQKDLELRYESLLSQREEIKGQQNNNQSKVLESDARVTSAARSLRDGTQALNMSFKQNPLTCDNLMKIQDDRKFLQDVIEETLAEVINRNTFDSLVNAVTMEKEKKAALQQTILKEEESRKLVKSLQKQLIEVNKEKENEIQVCYYEWEMRVYKKWEITRRKPRLVEGKYIKKDAEVPIADHITDFTVTFTSTLKYKIDEEARVNTEIEAYLKQHHQYSEYEKVVIEDRVEKEKARRQAEQEAEELRATVKVRSFGIFFCHHMKIQSWWRGVMVRRQLGPYSKKKKKKGKKGKKSGKKGKKGKK
ncbi:hypothetical protein QZH41_013308, partial [Actinostola sp. cb2023]